MAISIKSIKTCSVCGWDYSVRGSNLYVAEEVTPLFQPNKYYDAIDCPHCGCQIILGERFLEYEKKEGDDIG